MHALGERGWQVLPDVVGPHGQLPVTAVDEDHEADGRGTPEGEDGVQGGADGAAGEEDVIDQHHRAIVDRHGDLGLGQRAWSTLAATDVVAIQGHVERADRHLGALDVGDVRGKSVCERDPARLDADEDQALGAVVRLDDLVGEAPQGTRDLVGIEEARHRREPDVASIVTALEPDDP